MALQIGSSAYNVAPYIQKGAYQVGRYVGQHLGNMAYKKIKNYASKKVSSYGRSKRARPSNGRYASGVERATTFQNDKETIYKRKPQTRRARKYRKRVYRSVLSHQRVLEGERKFRFTAALQLDLKRDTSTTQEVVLGACSVTANDASDEFGDMVNIAKAFGNNFSTDGTVYRKFIVRFMHCELYMLNASQGAVILDVYRVWAKRDSELGIRDGYIKSFTTEQVDPLFPTPVTQPDSANYFASPFNTSTFGKYFTISKSERIVLQPNQGTAMTISVRKSHMCAPDTWQFGPFGTGTSFVCVKYLTNGLLIRARLFPGGGDEGKLAITYSRQYTCAAAPAGTMRSTLRVET